MYHCYEVVANVELDIEEIVDAILKEYEDITIEDVDMEFIYEYIDSHITYMKSRNSGHGIREVEDGPSINGFEIYYDIENELNRIKRERGVDC